MSAKEAKAVLDKNLALADRIRLRIPILDRIDQVRNLLQGHDVNVPIPKLVVVGDQSSGKSSVLEAIAKVDLPRGSGMVTRVPIFLQLRHAKEELVLVSYTVGSQEIDDKLTQDDSLETVLREAQRKVTGNDYGVCDTPVTVRIEGPDQVDLTLLDLPGLIQNKLKDQPADIIQVIKALVRKYVSDPNAVILATSDNDPQNSAGIGMASEVDPEGKRTLVVLTKSDLCGATELYSRCTDDRLDVRTLGFIPVVCRSQEDLANRLSFEASRAKEEEHFRKVCVEVAGFRKLKLGVPALVDRLTDLQRKRVIEALPEIRARLHEAKDEAERRLQRMGPQISSEDDARDVLDGLLSKLAEAMQYLLEAKYDLLHDLGVSSLELQDVDEEPKSGKASGMLMRLFSIKYTKFNAELSGMVDSIMADEFLEFILQSQKRTAGLRLEGLPSPEVFDALYRKGIFDKLSAPCMDFLDGVSGDLGMICESLVQDLLVDYEVVQSRVGEGLSQLIEQETKGTRALIEAILEAHSDAYGLRAYFEEDKKALKESEEDLEDEEGDEENDDDVSPAEATALETQEKLVLFAKVIQVEVVDVVVRVVRQHLLKAVAKKAHRYLYDREVTQRHRSQAEGSDFPEMSLFDDMVDQLKLQERTALERRISALKTAAARLQA